MQDVNLQTNIYFTDGYTSAVVGTFGDNVRRLRIAAGLKGNQLARRVNVTPPVVSGWEKNRTGLPETPTLLKLAKAMRCTVDDLLDGVDEEYAALLGDLGRHGQDQSSAPYPGGADGSASARILELEHIVEAQAAVLREMQDVAGSLVELAVRGVEAREVGAAAPARRGHRRKIG